MKAIKHISLVPILGVLAAIVLVSLSSCDKIQGKEDESTKAAGTITATSMVADVAPVEDIKEAATKSTSNHNNGTVICDGEEDGFYITEYVSDIEDCAPATKGWEITTANIASKYGKFAMDAW